MKKTVPSRVKPLIGTNVKQYVDWDGFGQFSPIPAA